MFKNIKDKTKNYSLEILSGDNLLKIERRLQMLIALILFTPTILTSLGSDSLQQDKSVLTWGINISIYLTLYLYLEISGKNFNVLRGKILNYGILLNLAAFIPFFFLIALYQNFISGFPAILFFIATTIIFWFPIILLSVLIIEFFINRKADNAK
jgi:hypothetical protein